MILEESDKCISRGMYGHVYNCKVDGKDDYIVKKCHPYSKNTIQCPLEPCILMSFDHPNIVKCETAFMNKELDVVTVQQKCTSNLYRENELSVETVAKYTSDILRALLALSERSVIHGDIKPANILILDGKAILCDFGLSILLVPGQKFRHDTICTSLYRPLEVHLKKDYSTAIDIWSLGCVMIEMMTDREFISSKDSIDPILDWAKHSDQDVQPIPEEFKELQCGETYSRMYTELGEEWDPLLNLALSMLRINPKERPTAKSILTSGVLDKYIGKYKPTTYSIKYQVNDKVPDSEIFCSRRLMSIKVGLNIIPPELDYLFKCFRKISSVERASTFASLTYIMFTKLTIIKGMFNVNDIREHKKSVDDLSFMLFPPN